MSKPLKKTLTKLDKYLKKLELQINKYESLFPNSIDFSVIKAELNSAQIHCHKDLLESLITNIFKIANKIIPLKHKKGITKDQNKLLKQMDNIIEDLIVCKRDLEEHVVEFQKEKKKIIALFLKLSRDMFLAKHLLPNHKILNRQVNKIVPELKRFLLVFGIGSSWSIDQIRENMSFHKKVNFHYPLVEGIPHSIIYICDSLHRTDSSKLKKLEKRIYQTWMVFEVEFFQYMAESVFTDIEKKQFEKAKGVNMCKLALDGLKMFRVRMKIQRQRDVA